MLQEKNKWMISTILTAMAILLPIILFMLSLSVKDLKVEIVSKSELIGKEFSIEDIEIKIEGKNTNTLVLYTLRISNSGSEPILKDDFERPVFIDVREDSKIYLAKVKKKIPNNISIKMELIDNKVMIEPMLLNPEDEFELELFSSSIEYPVIDARIAGVPAIDIEIPEAKEQIWRYTRFLLSFFLFIFYSKHFMTALFLNKNYSAKLSLRIVNIIFGVLYGTAASLLLLDAIGRIDFKENINYYAVMCTVPGAIGILWFCIEEKIFNKSNTADCRGN
jgi:hypothetical protein